MNKTIAAEPMLPQSFLDSMSAMPINDIFGTMFGMGIMPKPAEVQRIIIVKAGGKEIANELDNTNQIFDYKDNSSVCPCRLNGSNFSDTLSKALMPYLEKRSCFAPFLQKRISEEIEKKAFYSSTQGNDYWLESNPDTSSPVKSSNISPVTKALAGLAAIYTGLKLKSLGYGPRQLAEIFTNKPWLRTLLGGGVVWKLQDNIAKANRDESMLRPASDYSDILQNTNFSGHIKTSGLADAILLPNSYIVNAINQEAIQRASESRFPGVGERSKTASFITENNSILNKNDINLLNKRILNIIL